MHSLTSPPLFPLSPSTPTQGNRHHLSFQNLIMFSSRTLVAMLALVGSSAVSSPCEVAADLTSTHPPTHPRSCTHTFMLVRSLPLSPATLSPKAFPSPWCPRPEAVRRSLTTSFSERHPARTSGSRYVHLPARSSSINHELTHPFLSASRLGFPQAAHCTELGTNCPLDPDQFNVMTKKNDNSTKPAKASKYADDVNFVSCKMWPNLKPRVRCADEEITTSGKSYNVVEWKLPKADIVLDKKYSFTIKLKLGSDVEDDDIPFVVFAALTSDATFVPTPALTSYAADPQFLPIAIK